ncbi:MAG: CHAT domain-containing tetratricopeptide repeat protein [Bacteroidota bacterium]
MFRWFCWMALLGCLTLSAQVHDSVGMKKDEVEINRLYALGKYQESLELLQAGFPRVMRNLDWHPEGEGAYFKALAHCFYPMGEVDSAIFYGKKGWIGLRETMGDSARPTLDALYEIGFYFDAKLRFDSSLYYYQRALKAYETHLTERTDDIPLNLHQMAVIYDELGMFDKALPLSLRAYNLWVELYGFWSDRVLTSTRTLNSLFASLGNEEQAIIYAKKGIEITDSIYHFDPNRRISAHAILSRTYESFGKKALWAEELDKIGDILASFDQKSPIQHTYYSARGRWYNKQKRYAEAVDIFRRARDLIYPVTSGAATHWIRLAGNYINLAQNFKGIAAYDSALYYQDEALKIYAETYPRRNFYTYFEQLDTYFLMGDTTRALAAMGELLRDFSGTKEKDLGKLLSLPLERFPDHQSVKVMLRTADHLWRAYAATGKQAYLTNAKLAFEQLDTWYDPIHRVRLRFSRPMAEFRTWIYKGLLRVYAAEYQQSQNPEKLARAFWAADMQKSYLLYALLRQQSNLDFANVPEAVQAEESMLRGRITYLSALASKGEVSEAKEEELMALTHEYETLQLEIKQNYPAFFDLLKQEPIQVKDFRSMFPGQTGALVYALADSVLYTFALNETQAELMEQALPPDFEENCQAYRRLLFDYEHYRQHPTEDAQALASKARELYDLLMAPAIAFFEEVPQSWLIVPDGYLSSIPMETLLDAAPEAGSTDFRDFPFLLKKYTLSYGYSASLFWQQHRSRRSAWDSSPRLASFAPSYNDALMASMESEASGHLGQLLRDGLTELEGAQQEASEIAAQWNGDFYAGKEATKANFLDKAPHYTMLHLAMHALIDPDKPLLSCLTFSAPQPEEAYEPLYAAELFSLSLQTDLVVLSACNSGYESLEPSLGNYSLAKAFQYAGSPSVLMSLWKVSDKETRDLMLRFYGQLETGQSKAEALRQAKLGFLEDSQVAELSHPFFWAGFVLSGNRDPLPDADIPWALVGLVLLLTGLGGLLWFRWQTRPEA